MGTRASESQRARARERERAGDLLSLSRPWLALALALSFSPSLFLSSHRSRFRSSAKGQRLGRRREWDAGRYGH